MIWLALSFVVGLVLLLGLALSKKARPSGKTSTGTFTLPKISLAGYGHVIVKVLGAAAVLGLIYFLPQLVKDSLPGKTLLSALGDHAEWYDWVVWIVLGGATVLIAVTVYNHLANKQISTTGGWVLVGLAAIAITVLAYMSDEEATNLKQSGEEVFVDQRKLATKQVPMGIHDTAKHQIAAHRAPGMVFITCARVVEPAILVDNDKAPEIQFERLPGPSSYTNHFKLTDAYRTYLVNQAKIARVVVEWKIEEVPFRQPNCPHTRWQ